MTIKAILQGELDDVNDQIFELRVQEARLNDELKRVSKDRKQLVKEALRLATRIERLGKEV